MMKEIDDLIFAITKAGSCVIRVDDVHRMLTNLPESWTDVNGNGLARQKHIGCRLEIFIPYELPTSSPK